MVPFGIEVAFSPKTRQLVPLQLSDFPADDADGPTSTVTPVIPDERAKPHCTAVGNAPPDEEMLIGSETTEPARPEPEAMVKETVGWASAGSAARISDKTNVFADIIFSFPCPSLHRSPLGRATCARPTEITGRPSSTSNCRLP